MFGKHGKQSREARLVKAEIKANKRLEILKFYKEHFNDPQVQELTQTQVAERFGTTQSTIQQTLKHYGRWTFDYVDPREGLKYFQ